MKISIRHLIKKKKLTGPNQVLRVFNYARSMFCMLNAQKINFLWKLETFAHYEIYTWTLCHSYLHEKQTSRIQSLREDIEQAN